MREIKFRAWDIKRERMVDDRFSDYGISCVTFDGFVCQLSRGTLVAKSKFELMQYTGLKDCKGREVYEGDIVKYKYGDGSGGIAPVFYKDGCFEVGQGYVSCLGAMSGGIEVIGNIYENKDLI